MVACIIFIALAGIFAAVMDKLQFNFLNSVFQKLPSGWWDPSKSWKNKYKKDLKTPLFFGATTFFSWITDAWHLAQFMFLKFLFLGVCFYHRLFLWPIDFIILHALFTGTKELFFRYILHKKYGNKA